MGDNEKDRTSGHSANSEDTDQSKLLQTHNFNNYGIGLFNYDSSEFL